MKNYHQRHCFFYFILASISLATETNFVTKLPSPSAALWVWDCGLETQTSCIRQELQLIEPATSSLMPSRSLLKAKEKLDMGAIRNGIQSKSKVESNAKRGLCFFQSMAALSRQRAAPTILVRVQLIKN